MPRIQQKPVAKRLSLFLIVALIFFTMLQSCKSDKKNMSASEQWDGPDLINFLINNEEKSGKDRIPLDLTENAYYENKKNPDHVMFVPIMDSVYFKDISRFSDEAPGQRQWYVDGQPLKSDAAEVAFYSEVVGPSKVILKYNDYIHVSKGIYFTDELDFSTEVAETTTEYAEKPDEDFTAIASTNENVVEEKSTKPVAKVEKQQSNTKPTSTSNTSATKTSNTSATNISKAVTPTPTPAKPAAPVEITKVDFYMEKTTAETGERILFRDLSEPAVAVSNRVWDWGDGNTMPLRSSAAGYSYEKPGTYTVKLCLNYSPKCVSKQINITQAKAIISAAPPAPPTETKKVEEVKVSKVVISSASKQIVGKPIEVTDDTYPKEAVKTRAWYINGTKENFTSSKFSKTFEKAGNYTIKLCVNGDNSTCQEKVITIEDLPKPAPAKQSTSTANNDPFFAAAASRTGLRTSQRCPEENAKWHGGVTEITLKPTVRVELMSANIFGKKTGLASAKLTDGSFTKTIKNIQILPGSSTIEFGDFGVILQPGKTYTLSIESMPGENVELEDGGVCNTTFAADDRLGASYKDNVMTLYNIKFGY